MLFDLNILPTEKFPLPIICVGNISVGGTGKTPFTEYIVALLLKHHYRVAALSRGYKRNTTGFRFVTADSPADEAGDEACQLKRKYPAATVAVDANRRRGVRNLLALPEGERPQVIILDDAMQHRYITPTLVVMLTEYNNMYYEDHILPVGDLREAASNAYRADIVVVTKCPQSLKPIDMRIIEKNIHLLANQRLFFSETEYMTPMPVFSAPTVLANAPTVIANAVKQSHDSTVIANAVKQSHSESRDCFVPRNDAPANILAVAGIAHPAPFIAQVKTLSPNVIVRLFPDHHLFTNDDVRQLNDALEQLPPDNRLIICTEKDAMRFKTISSLPDEWKKCMYCLPIAPRFMFNKGADFNDIILKHVLSTININK
jgi:tetraacyldisaccharide 4'-kinase